MKIIEVEWTVTPKSGITNIDLNELGCKSIEEWDSLSIEEKYKRIENAIPEHDLSMIKFHCTYFETTEDDL
jgi:hypothetical protein